MFVRCYVTTSHQNALWHQFYVSLDLYWSDEGTSSRNSSALMTVVSRTVRRLKSSHTTRAVFHGDLPTLKVTALDLLHFHDKQINHWGWRRSHLGRDHTPLGQECFTQEWRCSKNQREINKQILKNGVRISPPIEAATPLAQSGVWRVLHFIIVVSSSFSDSIVRSGCKQNTVPVLDIYRSFIFTRPSLKINK